MKRIWCCLIKLGILGRRTLIVSQSTWKKWKWAPAKSLGSTFTIRITFFIWIYLNWKLIATELLQNFAKASRINGFKIRKTNSQKLRSLVAFENNVLNANSSSSRPLAADCHKYILKRCKGHLIIIRVVWCDTCALTVLVLLILAFPRYVLITESWQDWLLLSIYRYLKNFNVKNGDSSSVKQYFIY